MKHLYHRTGMALGSLFALMHALWALMVAIGWSEFLFGWWQRYHFYNKAVTFSDFDLITGFVGFLWAFIVGYIVGWVFAYLYDWFKK